MSVRLTNDLRDKIQKNLINHKFIKPLDKLADRRAKFSVRVYNDVFSKKERDLMEKCPKGWLNQDTSIRVAFGGGNNTQNLYFNGDNHRYSCHREISIKGTRRDSIKMIVPNGEGYGRCYKRYENDHKLFVEFYAIEDAEDELHKQVHEAMSQSKAALYSVNTLKQLLELWPEVEEFIPEYALRQDTTGKKNLPAIPVDDLNASFGLKRKAA